MLHAVRAVQEVELVSGMFFQVLGIPVRDIEVGHRANERKETGETPQRVPAAADVEPIAHEVLGAKSRCMQPPGDRLAALVHAGPLDVQRSEDARSHFETSCPFYG